MESNVSPSMLDIIPGLLASYLVGCLSTFRLGISNEWEGPFAPSFKTSAEQDELIIHALQRIDHCHLTLGCPDGASTTGM